VNETDRRAFLLYEAAEQAGWKDVATVLERLRAVERGISAEDEFALILQWLGQCRLVHKLDQGWVSARSPDIRVPDLLAVFQRGDSTQPVLIEVKQSKGRLKWREDYLAALQTYADAVRLPLLIAWKWNSFWGLFEPRHLRKAITNYHGEFLQLMPNSLLSELAGDFSFALRPGVGIHLPIRKHEDDPTLGTVEGAYATDGDGNRYDAAVGLFQILACFPTVQSVVETETYILRSFEVPSGGASEMAHRCLAQLLAIDSTAQPKWSSYLQGSALPSFAANFHEAVGNLGKPFIGFVGRQRPLSTPQFLAAG
jgi:Holliday junction resolvase